MLGELIAGVAIGAILFGRRPRTRTVIINHEPEPELPSPQVRVPVKIFVPHNWDKKNRRCWNCHRTEIMDALNPISCPGKPDMEHKYP
jgi:hypothetical protein